MMVLPLRHHPVMHRIVSGSTAAQPLGTPAGSGAGRPVE